ncbi:MAG: hypothetical protein EPN85_06980 [Bacteroidetes bacterium]|nr:MAG: hypothetical protein EPN85_06980 [Bacteroidota bacterium]
MKTSLSRIILLFSFFSLIIISINSCRKDRPDTDTQSSVDNSICEGEFSRMFPQTNSIAVNDSGVQKWGIDIPVPYGNCPDYFIDSADIADGFPVTLWMYYGHDNDGDSICEIVCTGNDGKVRKGIVKAVFSGSWNKTGSAVTHYLKNYFVNGIQYEGVIDVARTGNTFTQTVTGGKCTKGSDWTILWNSSRTITALVGDTANPFDDVCLISGTASGTDRKGKSFSVDIDPANPIRREMGCPYIVKGMQTLKLEGKKDRTINYGDGTCDNVAVLTIDGNEFEFKLQ